MVSIRLEMVSVRLAETQLSNETSKRRKEMTERRNWKRQLDG